jgi:Na+-driven multidrug efflux pump
MLNGMVSALLLRIPLAWLLGIQLGYGLHAVGYAVPLATVGSLMIGIVYIGIGAWKKSNIGLPVPPDV